MSAHERKRKARPRAFSATEARPRQHASSEVPTDPVALALAAELERQRQIEEADAAVAATRAAALGLLRGYLPGQEPPSIRAVRGAQPQQTVAMYDSQVARSAPLSADVSRAGQLLPGDGRVRVVSVPRLNHGISKVVEILSGSGTSCCSTTGRTAQAACKASSSSSSSCGSSMPSDEQCTGCYKTPAACAAWFRLPCKCAYCDDCMRQQLFLATKDIWRLPLQCCKVPHDDKFATALLEEEPAKVYSRLRQEALAPVKLHCPRCSAFIDVAQLMSHMDEEESEGKGESEDEDEDDSEDEEGFMSEDQSHDEGESSSEQESQDEEDSMHEEEPINEEKSGNFTCSCGQRLCLACVGIAHPHMTCEQFMALPEEVRRDPTDFAAFKYLESKGWKRCPGCRFYVERNGGCPNMRCRCGAKFHYLGYDWEG